MLPLISVTIPARRPRGDARPVRRLTLYHRELDGIADQQLASLPDHARREIATFMDAAVIADPMEYQRPADEPSRPLRAHRQSSLVRDHRRQAAHIG